MPNFSGFFTRNLTLKVSAFVVALLLWLSVQWEAPGQFQHEDVPVRVDLSDPDWVLVGTPDPGAVRVSLQGSSGDLSRAGRPTIVVPMDEVTATDTLIELRREWVRLPDRPGIGVDDIQPSAVRFTFEPVERRSVPLAFGLENDPPEGLALAGPPLPAAAEVRVTGPRSRLAGIDSVRFLPLDLSQLTGTGTVELVVDSATVDGLQVQPPTVEVDYRMEEVAERTIPGVPVVFEDSSLAELFEGVPDELSVVLSGARSRVDRIDPGRLEVVIEIDSEELPDPGEEVAPVLRVRGLPAWVAGRPEAEGTTLVRRPEVP